MKRMGWSDATRAALKHKWFYRADGMGPGAFDAWAASYWGRTRNAIRMQRYQMGLVE